MYEYRAGKVSVANGSTQVQGHRTRWLTYIREGDVIYLSGSSYVVASIDDINKLTLETPYIGVALVEHPYTIVIAESLLRAKEVKSKQILQKYNEAVDSAIENYSWLEVISWHKQELQAIEYLADSGADVPLLEALATQNNVTKTVAANYILSKKAARDTAIGNLIGKKQYLLTQVDNATTITEVQAINW